MANEDVQEFKDATFESEVLSADKPVLVDFWAPWCAPCRAIAPSVEALASEYAERVKVGKINIDDEQAIAEKYRIRSIPTVMVFKNGKPFDQVMGAVPKSKLKEMLDKAL